MKRFIKIHPSIPKLHRWLRCCFDFEVDLSGLTINHREIELDLSAGRE